MNRKQILKHLHDHASSMRAEVSKVEQAIALLIGSPAKGRRGSKMSAAARAKIGAAQRKRWAKWKAAKK